MSLNYLIEETMGDGRYRLVEPLQLGPARKLYVAANVSDPSEQYLASIVTAAKTPDPQALRQKLGYHIEGVFELSFIGPFDQRGNDPDDWISQRQHWAMLERATPGCSLRTLLHEPISEGKVAWLGISIGEILLRASRQGVDLYDVRPESIWALNDRERLKATGLTARSEALYQHQGKTWTQLQFPHHYHAPERVHANTRSLTFTLATILAEAILGTYPFPAPGPSRLNPNFWHAPRLPISPGFAALMQLAFETDPIKRPDLSQFLDELAGLPT